MQRSRLLAILLTTSAALAQSTIVSPIGATTVEGSGSNLFPWTTATARRYQQIHGDVGGTPKLITRLSFRVNGSTTNNLGTRVYDMDLYMGEGGAALQPSFTFDNNYLGAPFGKTLVIPRTLITFGPQGQGIGSPNPFTANMDLPLTTPFVYSGLHSLVWETTFYGMTIGAGGTFGTPDAEQGVLSLSTPIVTGAGCIATGQSAQMTHGVTVTDCAGTLMMNFTVAAGPFSSPCLLALGRTNPNLPVPGLCSPLLTDLFQILYIGNTDVGGSITTNTPSASTFSFPNTIPGAVLFTQVHGIDFARVGELPVCNSDGRQTTIPGSNLARVNLATRIFNNLGGTGATEGIFFNTTIGYALVTQFTY
jgi:hypothetical protein